MIPEAADSSSVTRPITRQNLYSAFISEFELLLVPERLFRYAFPQFTKTYGDFLVKFG